MFRLFFVFLLIVSPIVGAQQIPDITETTPTATEKNDSSPFDAFGSMGGFGAFGGLALVGALMFINWKRGSNKPINARVEQVQQKKEDAQKIIIQNDKMEDMLHVVFDQKAALSKDTERRINVIVEETAQKVQEVLKEEDPRVTIARITTDWKG